MGCIINMEMVVAYAFVIGKISPLPLNLVNKSVSRETSMLAANRLTQIGNERMSGDCLLPALVHRTFACMSASLWTASSSARQTAHLSVSMSTTATKHLPGSRIRLGKGRIADRSIFHAKHYKKQRPS